MLHKTQMFDRRIKYADIVEKEPIVLDYLVKHSDMCSFIATFKKPYSQFPPRFDFDEQLRPFITDYILERDKWPIGVSGQEMHHVMVICRCCKGLRSQIKQLPSLLLAENSGMPEDIALYRNGFPMFVTVSHEEIANIYDATDDDVKFLKENGITVSDGRIRDLSVLRYNPSARGKVTK